MEFKLLNESEVVKNGNSLEILATPQSDFLSDCLNSEKI